MVNLIRGHQVQVTDELLVFRVDIRMPKITTRRHRYHLAAKKREQKDEVDGPAVVQAVREMPLELLP